MINAFCSPATGTVIREPLVSADSSVFFVNQEVPWPKEEWPFLFSVIDDWMPIEAKSEQQLIAVAQFHYWLTRATNYSVALFGKFSDDLRGLILEHLDFMIRSHVSSDTVLNRLLLAPLREEFDAHHIAEEALGHGYAAVASLFDAVSDFQPLLRRLCAAWLALPLEEFEAFDFDRTYLWNAIAQFHLLPQILNASSPKAFTAAWSGLVFNIPSTTPTQRATLNRIGTELSEKIFPTASRFEPDYESLVSQEDFKEASSEPKTGANAAEDLRRTLRQVDVILETLAEGDDVNARRFLSELLSNQLRTAGGEVHAVKSLCNVAQRCAEMYRTDFERVCLDEACNLFPTDEYALVQMGDHLKRCGEFEAAIAALEKARPYARGWIVDSSIADVWAQGGEFNRAIELYKRINGWEAEETIRTAIADNLRRGGDLEGAEREYSKVLTKWQNSYRSLAGLAEIAKTRGDFEAAKSRYEQALAMPKTDPRDARVDIWYQLAIGRLLKLLGKHNQAYEIVDQIVRNEPFLMAARIERASILGLLGNVQSALIDIPPREYSGAFGEWVGQYHRGLLFLRLKRFGEAKRDLIENMRDARMSCEDAKLLRLGAAMAYICDRQFEPAEEILRSEIDAQDAYVRYIKCVLELHIATMRRQEARIALLRDQLKSVANTGGPFKSVVDALAISRFDKAMQIELSLLSMAA
jgi:tetratricopeptide (TPR) repeat protein